MLLGYQTDLFTAFPQLETLNGIDRQGRRTLPPEIGSNVPGWKLFFLLVYFFATALQM